MPLYEYRCPNGHEFEVIRKDFVSHGEDSEMCRQCGCLGLRVWRPANYTLGWEMIAMNGEPDVPTRRY